MSISDLYGELRPRAFAIAYQMLGSVSEAEDVVHEAFLRMHQTLQRDEPIASPRAYVATLVTRLAIDQLRSARVRRERYVGEWLPEPVRSRPSTPSPIRTSYGTSTGSTTSVPCCARAADPATTADRGGGQDDPLVEVGKLGGCRGRSSSPPDEDARRSSRDTRYLRRTNPTWRRLTRERGRPMATG
jgi:RNA polymerase sigma factor (sigma-70 family)